MNNVNNNTWQDRARELALLRKNPLSDIYTIQRLRKSLEWVNTSGLSQEEFGLLNKAFN